MAIREFGLRSTITKLEAELARCGSAAKQEIVFSTLAKLFYGTGCSDFIDIKIEIIEPLNKFL